jgi:diketogulonate reductase-like aldo/keto reductase
LRRCAKSRKHIEENVRAADIVLTAEDLAEIDRIERMNGTATLQRLGRAL